MLVDNPELAQKYRDLAPRRITEAYQWPAVSEDYERLFQKVHEGHYRRSTSCD